MEAVLTYLLQSSVSIVVLYLLYRLFLEKDTFFGVNRFYLVGAMLFSLVVPLIRFDITMDGSNATMSYLLETITITPETWDGAMESGPGLFNTLIIIYFTGAALFLARFFFQFGQVIGLVRRFGIRREQGLRLVFTDKSYQPFSFFRLIFIPGDLHRSEALPQIIEHERVHVRQAHTVDLILLELLTVVQWFNPIIWMYRRSMKSLHEYLADEGVLHSGYDRYRYQEQLLNQSLGIQVNDLVHNFNHSLLKNRIIMMTKERSNRFRKWKAIMAIPAALCLVMVFSASVNVSVAQEKPPAPEKQVPPPPPPAAGDEVFIQVHKAPEFKGGHEGLAAYMVSNVKYPEASKKNGVQGTVFVSFVVEKDGHVTNQSVLKGVAEDLDAEALRVIREMPDWKPGYNEEGKPVRVQMNLPIKFKLDDKVKTEEKK